MEKPRCFKCELRQCVEPDEVVLVITGVDADCWHYVWTCPSCDIENREFVDAATAERLCMADAVIEVTAVVPPDVLAERAEMHVDQEDQEELFATFEEQFEPEDDAAVLAEEPAATMWDTPVDCQGCDGVFQMKDAPARVCYFLLEPTFSLLAGECPRCEHRLVMFPPLSELFRLIEIAQNGEIDLALVVSERPMALIRQLRAEQLLATFDEAEGGE